MRRALVLAAALSLGGALSPSCAASTPPLSIAYLASFSEAGVRRDPDGEGWSTTTDRGYEVHVLEGSLTTFAATLVPSPEDDGAVALLSVLVPSRAHAGHVENADPSQIEPDVTESLAPGVARVLGRTLVVQPGPYASAHYLVSGSVDTSSGVPTRAPSLTIAFEARDAAGELVRASSVATTIATGVIDAIDPPVAGTSIEVTFERPLGTLFDGLELADATLSDADIASALLLRIARETRAVSVTAPE